jgi:hypothetical protein
MPPGMLQQMQRQMRNGGMQEMMRAMMQGQGGDQADMEEMQRTCLSFFSPLLLCCPRNGKSNSCSCVT